MKLFKIFCLLFTCTCNDEVSTKDGNDIQLITEQPRFKKSIDTENIENLKEENYKSPTFSKVYSELCSHCSECWDLVGLCCLWVATTSCILCCRC
ncbi:hypothetical protein NBO_81g0025 [Nosema bombycis CQ1]|uniref:Uncharacterized protein n=1 Tax=Nosema bombycis (strain CQ1 / CVCC 102059) TaxID=578461 RepID=R0KSY1_NOSB1|nr:hypothetical protein NBO_81g0025 [Nosema bombycis CQ1]|eukprot:EOB13332.1 hypothetical protein NBO_81g0025 [Nosema bombycis CQ1]